MNDFYQGLWGFIKLALISALLFFFLLFSFKDVYSNGYRPQDLLPYRTAIFWGLNIFTILELIVFVSGGILLLWQRKKAQLSGWMLGFIILLVYMVYFYRLYNGYWI